MRSTRIVRVLPAAAVLAAVLFAAPATSPAPVAGVGPLPDCRLDDIFTEPRGYDDWQITQVDWILTLGPDYKPPDLVSVRNSGIAGGGLIREIVIDDLTALVKAAKANGTPLVAWSPYRGYSQQVKLFNGYAGWNGEKYTNFDSAINFSARPGHSEHQTGLTIDFVAVGDYSLTSNWEVTRTGGWMAKTIHDSGLTIREYLWANYTQVDPTCVALPPPKLVTPGKPRSCALAAPSPSPTAVPPTASPPATDAASPPPTASAVASPAPTATPVPENAGSDLGPAGIGVAILGLLVLAIGGIALMRRSHRPT